MKRIVLSLRLGLEAIAIAILFHTTLLLPGMAVTGTGCARRSVYPGLSRLFSLRRRVEI